MSTAELYPAGTVTTDRILPDRLYPGTGRVEQYQTLEVEQLTPGNSAITYDVLDGLSNQPIPGYYHILPDPAGQIDLRSIDAAVYPIVKLRAQSSCRAAAARPPTSSMGLTCQMQYEPTSVEFERFDAAAASGLTIGLIWVWVASAGLAVLLGWRVKRFLRRSF